MYGRLSIHRVVASVLSYVVSIKMGNQIAGSSPAGSSPTEPKIINPGGRTCDTCGTENRVVFLCKDCSQVFCPACKVSHVSDHRSHDVVYLFENRNIKAVSLETGNTCYFHPTNSYQAICRECDILVCHQCVFTQQHKHHEFIPIHDVINLRKNELLQEIRDLKQILLPELKRTLTVITNKQEEADQIGERLTKDINAQVDRMVAEISDIRDELLKIVEKRRKPDIENLGHKRKEVEEHIADIQELTQNCEEELNSSSKTITELFSYIKDTQFKVVDMYKEHTVPQLTRYKFSQGYISRRGVGDLFGKVDEIKGPGTVPKVNLNTHRRKVDSCHSIIDESVLSSFQTHSRSDLTFVQPINANDAWTKSAASNLTLVRIGGSEVKHFRIDFSIEDATVSQSGDLYVTSLTTGKFHQVIKISQKGRPLEFSNLYPYEPYGVCCTRDNDLLVCLQKKGDSHIVRISIAGRIIQRMRWSKDGNLIFKQPLRIAENGNTDIAVVDTGLQELVVLGRVGTVRFRYDGKSGFKRSNFSPRCVECDKQNNFVVSDFRGDCLHIIDKEGKFLRVLTSNMIQQPMGVGIGRDGKLWITQSKSKVNVIKYLA